MPFTAPFIDIINGHLIYGWGAHRALFMFKHAKAAKAPRIMEEYGIGVSSNTPFGTALQGHSKYGHVVDKTTSAPTWTDQDAAQKCKGGLWWATRNGVHVHFYLGGLNLDMVVGSGQAKSKGITCRELRWAFRFQADAQVQAFIQFWRPVGITTLAGLKDAPAGSDAEKCGPPWLDSVFTDATQKWAAYTPRGNHDINGVHV